VRLALLLVPVGALAIVSPVSAAMPGRLQRGLQRQLTALVAIPGGPPGAIVTLRSGSHTTVLKAGFADVRARRSPEATDHMRIASIAKAFSGALAFKLIARGRLSLNDTVGASAPGLPSSWAAVTLRELLNHTSGLPDYTKSNGFLKQFQTDPHGFVSPQKIISWVAGEGTVFDPGKRYEYSNTDNIVVGLIAEHATGTSYATLLRDLIFGPLKLTGTSFPTEPPLPSPFIHGYATEAGHPPTDISTLLSPSGAWASGAIVSSPNDLNTFIGAYLSGRLVSPSLQHSQLQFVPGSSSPAGPGTNSAGLGIFRYRTRCGTVYGHTGTFPGYVQFAAATRNGSRAVTASFNISAPKGVLLDRLRHAEETAVCALLHG
jgi:D-alanyl-D-alanine carboxypeptidase